MQGSKIIVASEPRGTFLEGVVSGTPYPGTVMQLQAGTAPVGGRFTWEAYNPSADGDPRLWAVLIEDDLEGFAFSTAYVSGNRCKLYCPIPGEHMNMLVAGQVGTGSANAFTIAERFIAQHGTGLLIKESTSATQAPFISLEHIDLPADQQGWVWCMYTGR